MSASANPTEGTDAVGDWPWPAPADDGQGDHLRGGDVAVPDVALFSSSSSGALVNLRRLDRPAVVFVFPYVGAPGRPNPAGWDAIPGAHGSTPQAKSFSRLNADFEAAGYRLFGLSGMAIDDLRAFCDRESLMVPLLSDRDRLFARALSLPTFEAGGDVFLKRLTLVLADGVIEKVIYPVHPPDRHPADLLQRLAKSTTER